ncbi:MAG: CopG family transcriptional regulator [Chromatiaceae bacterium]|nr:CopG family transcriptional regulator [Chromatiaceae bacterium]MBP9605061.1 CopG family transcriptional regulator [Chromatiaceae bacterium]
MLSIRLDEQTEARFQAACRRLGLSKNEAIKRSLEQWLDRFEPPPDAFDLGIDLFDQGIAAEPPKDPQRRQIWERLRAKHRPG